VGAGGAGDDGRQPLHEFDALEEEVRRSIAPHRLEFEEDAPVGAEADAVLGERGAEEIATELLQSRVKPWANTPHVRNSRNSCSTKRGRPVPSP